MNNKKIEAVIFDMDGLLIDSMKYWIDTDSEFLKKYNVKLTEEMIKYFSGRSEIENMEWMIENLNMKGTVDELLKERSVETDKIYTEKTELMPGANNLIRKNKDSKIIQAIASGAAIRQIDIAVKRFGWKEYMDIIVSVDHVGSKGKPDPAVYLHTAEKLKVNPECCVVFEDAENGVVSAKCAGMKCIAVPDSRWSPGDFSKADLIVDSLEDERIFKFLNI